MILNDYSTAACVVLQLHLGGDRNFSYVLADRAGREAAVVDPGYGPDEIYAKIQAEGLLLQHVLITHSHSDHTGGVGRLIELSGARVHRATPGMAEGEACRLGSQAVIALPTPGHAPDHVCWLCNGFLASGDLLFCGKIGGTGPYFPGSSAAQEWESLHRLLRLPDETVVLPGHDYYGGDGVRPRSTIGGERRDNPFLLSEDFAAFVHLKDHWAEYKDAHGIR